MLQYKGRRTNLKDPQALLHQFPALTFPDHVSAKKLWGNESLSTTSCSPLLWERSFPHPPDTPKPICGSALGRPSAATDHEGKNIGGKKMKSYFLFFAPIFLPLILPEKVFARRKETQK
jgi:hypothetical protein